MEDLRCGPILFVREDGEIKFFLVRDEHVGLLLPCTLQEKNETEVETARRLLLELTGKEALKSYETQPIRNEYVSNIGGEKLLRKMEFYVYEFSDVELYLQRDCLVEYSWISHQSVRDSLGESRVVEILDDALRVLGQEPSV